MRGGARILSHIHDKPRGYMNVGETPLDPLTS